MWSELIGITLFVGYVGVTTTSLIRASNPPICAGLASDCVPSSMPLGTAYAVHAYATSLPTVELSVKVSEITKVPTIGPSIRSTHIGTIESSAGFENSCDNIVTGSGRVDFAERPWYKRLIQSSHRECESYLSLDIPSHWQQNRTNVYLTVIATKHRGEGYDQITFAPAVNQISLRYEPEKKDRYSRRYLLTGEPASKGVTAHSYMAVPQVVRVGPIAAFDRMNRTELRQYGRSHWLRDNDGYYSEMQIDTYVSPRDEYLPLAQMDIDFLRQKKLIAANGERLNPQVKIVLNGISWRKNAIEKLMMQGVANMEKQFGTNQYESDSLKLLFAGGSPIMLLVTFTVSMLHLLFELLAALSNWASFNKNCEEKSTAEAVSSRGIFIDTVLESLILAWLVDEGEGKIVQCIIGAKIAFNIYRYFKLTRIQAKPSATISELTLLVNPIDSLRPAVLAEKRKALNSNAFELWALIGQGYILLAVFTVWVVYQLVWVPQKSWPSALLKLGAHFAYGGGFIAMTPQLYKNYYHRSVKHLPWIALTYSFLNTIIDDLFSFLIRMPKEHRISVFRDDIIFVIYWIQGWHYKRVAAAAAAAAPPKKATT